MRPTAVLLAMASHMVLRDTPARIHNLSHINIFLGNHTCRSESLALYSTILVTSVSSDTLIDMLSETMTEGVPMCVDCGFQPYCGSDPVYHHATQGDAVGFKPSSGFCRRNMGVMRHLIRLLEDDERAASVLKGWI